MLKIPHFPKRIAHLDLKGIQRRPEYCLEYLEYLQALGYEGLLMEYEDVFPYQSVAFSLDPGEVWGRNFLASFLDKAGACGLRVIPLQQTLGHLEYALRWERYRVHGIKHPVTGEPIGTTTLHVVRRASREWMKSLLREMIAAHPESDLIHLGMDEAWPLVAYARECGADPMELFVGWLEELCDLCHEAGKTPFIWSDMLEDHFSEGYVGRLQALKEKVVLVHWDYTATSLALSEVRFAGWRTSRHCLDYPRDADAAQLRSDLLWMEDWSPEIASLTQDYRVGERQMESLFQAAVWKKLGFKVFGACGISIMMEGPLVSRYHRRMDNIDRWKDRVTAWALDGLFVTAWTRGGTFYPPTVLPDLHLPMLEYAAEKKRGNQIFRNISRERLWRLLAALGRCGEDWSIAAAVIKELSDTTGLVGSHLYEWNTLVLMAEVLRQRANVLGFSLLVEENRYANRWTWPEWSHRLESCRAAHKAFEALRADVSEHLTQRYYGRAFHEWIAAVFDVPLDALKRAEPEISKYLEESKRFYSEA